MDDFARERLCYHRERLEKLLSKIRDLTKEDSHIKLIQNIDDRHDAVKRWREKLRASGKSIDNAPQELDARVETARLSLAALPVDHIPERTTLPQPNNMPRHSSSSFTGREGDLHILAKYFMANNIVVITGMPGIGKTQLAAEFVHRYGQFFFGGVFWVSFANSQSIEAEIVACGRNMHLEDFDRQSDQQKVALVRSEWQKPIARLLIFDNCEDHDLLKKYQPTSGSCRLLITSHNTDWRALDIQVHTVQELSRTQSVTLLRKFRPDLPEDNATLAAIAGVLGDHPLALHLAGSYLKESQADVTPDEYLDDLRIKQLEHSSMKDQDPADADTNRSVSRSFALSYDKLDASKPGDMLALTTLFCIAHYAPGESIPRRLLRDTLGNTVETTTFSATIQRLKNLGLITEEQDKDLRMHRLLATFVRKQARKDTARETEARNLVEQSLAEKIGQLNQQGAIAPHRNFQPHLRHTAEEATQHNDKHAAALCREAGIYFYLLEEYETAHTYAAHALKIDEQAAAEAPLDLARSLESVANIQGRLGNNEQARALYERALELREQTVGANHSDVARSLNKLALLDISERKYTEAQRLLERALRIDEQESGLDSLNTAETLNNLSVLFDDQDKFDEAEPLYERVLDIRNAKLGGEHIQTAETHLHLGRLLSRKGSTAGALKHLWLAKKIFVIKLGHKHRLTKQANDAVIGECIAHEKIKFEQHRKAPQADSRRLADECENRAQKIEKYAQKEPLWLPLAQYLRGLAEQLQKEAPLDL